MGLMRLLPRSSGRPPAAVHDPHADAEVPAPEAEHGDDSATKETPTLWVLAFANQKGGVAKTTTTLNLGVAFKERGHRVLVIDLDPRGTLTLRHGLHPLAS